MSPTPARLVEALADWGCDPTPYEPYRPWHTYTTPGAWEPAGVLHHHTAGSSKLLTSQTAQAGMLQLLRLGYQALPGPLCHLAPAMVPGTTRARVWLIGWGNCNHAGMGDGRVLADVDNGRYAGRQGTAEDTDGNPYFWGLEYMHPGTTPVWPDALLDVGHRAGAAICQAQGWSEGEWDGRNLEHRQWTDRKIDRSWTGNVRAAVARLATEGPDVALTVVEINAVADAVVSRLLAEPLEDHVLNGTLGKRLVDMRTTLDRVIPIQKAVGAYPGEAGTLATQQGMTTIANSVASSLTQLATIDSKVSALGTNAVDVAALAAELAPLLGPALAGQVADLLAARLSS